MKLIQYFKTLNTLGKKRLKGGQPIPIEDISLAPAKYYDVIMFVKGEVKKDIIRAQAKLEKLKNMLAANGIYLLLSDDDNLNDTIEKIVKKKGKDTLNLYVISTIDFHRALPFDKQEEELESQLDLGLVEAKGQKKPYIAFFSDKELSVKESVVVRQRLSGSPSKPI